MIHSQLESGLLTLTLSRPERKNALTQKMYGDLAEAILHANMNPAVRVILLTGNENFTSGNDLADFVQVAQAGLRIEESQTVRFMHAVMACEKPLVAAVQGLAIGIGTTVLLHCDAVIVTETAKLSMPFTNLGLVPEFGSSQLLPQLAGSVKAAYYLLSGDLFSGREAYDMGIASHVVAATDFETKVQAVCQLLLDKPLRALRQSKALLKTPESKAKLLETIEHELHAFAAGLQSPDFAEAAMAFFEKRKPQWSQA